MSEGSCNTGHTISTGAELAAEYMLIVLQSLDPHCAGQVTHVRYSLQHSMSV